MAVLKHLASKSSNYGAVLTYLLYDHDEKNGKVVRDANGNRILRKEYWINGINCDPSEKSTGSTGSTVTPFFLMQNAQGSIMCFTRIRKGKKSNPIITF